MPVGNLQTLEVVSRYRDPKPQVIENYLSQSDLPRKTSVTHSHSFIGNKFHAKMKVHFNTR